MAGDELADDAAASYSGLRILLLEIIYDKLDEKNAADQGNSAARVLIWKARVILPENIYLRFLPLRHLVLHEDIPLICYSSAAVLSAPAYEQKTVCEFKALHSGPSPPLV